MAPWIPRAAFAILALLLLAAPYINAAAKIEADRLGYFE